MHDYSSTTMPINIATIPKKTKASTTKKKEESARVCKNNANGPDPTQPPSSPESDATDNEIENEVVMDAAAEEVPPKSTKKGTASKVSKIVSSAAYDRLGVNRLLTGIFPNEPIANSAAANSAAANSAAANSAAANSATANSAAANSAAANSAVITNPTAPRATRALSADPIADAIISSAFSELRTPPKSSSSTPNAPKKKQKNNKSKQNFNIIIHVEPKDDISKRLDFGKQLEDDSDDDDYVPGDSSDDYDDDEYDDDEYDDDDSYYSSSSSESDEDCNPAETEVMQQKFADEIAMMESLRATYEDMLAKDKTNRVVAKQLQTLKQSEEKIRKELDNLTYAQKRQNSKKFRKLLRKKTSTNDLEYFKTRLTLQEQRGLIEEMNAVAKVTAIEKPYKLTLLESDIPRDMKAVAIRKVGMLQHMEPGCGEYCKLKNWVEAFMQIPFNKNKNLPITMADGVDQCHEFMTVAKTRLDTAVYGLNDAKMQIMQMVGQWIANPAAIGTAVAIHGPPGTGKTSLVKEGISKILGRDFAFIALGGATDSSFLEGHSYTYEGSVWGKIVDILIRCKSSNPVIYFDELDKISETSKGEEIVGILTHLTDTSQNSQFHDKYFSEVAFDLSKCLFIFSYNDENRVNPVLLDRMYKIRTTGYSAKDKTYIAQHHLIPHIRTEVAFAEGDIIIPDSVVEYIVDHCTHKEAGVRNLKRCLEIIYTKLNLYRLMRPGTQLFTEKETSLEVSFPYTVSREVVDKLIKKGDADRPNINMYL